ncbi:MULTISPECIES: ECF transporter S component [Gracilibacillus]|uniref:ECF transporter S component n=1 Tax=Gracilibacillus TaxID=74385 RepID=UPI0008249073|nr:MULTISPECIES: ECF transporter S component [Gracilibacillus]
MKSTSGNLYRLIVLSIMGTIAVVLMFLSFPLPFLPPYLRIDISDIPALVAGVIFSPMAGVLVVAIKNILYLLITAISDPIGVVANFVAGVLFIVPVAYMFKKHRTKRSVIHGLLIGTVFMAVGMAVTNYFLFLPAYSLFMGWDSMSQAVKLHTVLIGFLPFNFIKGIAVGILFLLLFGKLEKWIQKT